MNLNATHTRLTQLARFSAVLGGMGILAIAIMVTMDVFARKFFGTSLGGATELSGLIFAIGTVIAYPFMLLDRASIRIDVVYAKLRVKARAILDFVAMAVVLYFGGMLTHSAYELLTRSWRLNSVTNGVLSVPLWIPQSLWVLGLFLLTLTALFLVIRAFIGIVRRDWSAVTRTAGIPSIEEEMHNSIHDAVRNEKTGA